MPPPGYEPFLQAICENPEDDTVRLVYADWLDENGDAERAEFIRLQIAVPTRPQEYDPRYARAEELRKRNWEKWFGELPKLSGIQWPHLFRRGFVGGVDVSAGKWLLQQREQVFGVAPVQNLTLFDAGQATVEKVLGIAEVDRLTGLCLRHCRVAPGAWGVLTQCPRFVRLKGLRVEPYLGLGRHQPIIDAGDVESFLTTPHLPCLEYLEIRASLGEEALGRLRSRFKDVRAWS